MHPMHKAYCSVWIYSYISAVDYSVAIWGFRSVFCVPKLTWTFTKWMGIDPNKFVVITFDYLICRFETN